MWNSNLWVSWVGSSSAVSGHHVACGEGGSGGGSELLGSRDALESPGLWGWLDNGVRGENWVVFVGGGGSELAGLDTELGSVLQESLGGTAAKWLAWFSFLAFRPLACWLALDWPGDVTKGTDSTINWHGGESSVDAGDLLGLGGSGGGNEGVLGELGLGHAEGGDLAGGLGVSEHLRGGIELSLQFISGLDEGLPCCLDWGEVILGPLDSRVMELLLAQDRRSGALGDFKDGSGSGSSDHCSACIGRGHCDASKSDTVGLLVGGAGSELLAGNDSGSLGGHGLGEGVSGVNLRTGEGGDVFSEILEKVGGTCEVRVGGGEVSICLCLPDGGAVKIRLHGSDVGNGAGLRVFSRAPLGGGPDLRRAVWSGICRSTDEIDGCCTCGQSGT